MPDPMIYGDDYFRRASLALDQCRMQVGVLAAMASRIVETLDNGGTILWMGNGGSAADAQHLSTELVGRFRHDRRALRSLAITTDTSLLTAVANDWDFSQIFVRQVQALAKPGDVVVGISTSGLSQNVNLALREARTGGAYTIGLFGEKPPPVAAYVNYCFLAPSAETCHVQECHIAAGQLICDLVEQHYLGQLSANERS